MLDFVCNFFALNILEKNFATWKTFGSKFKNFPEFLENSQKISLFDLEAFSFHFSFSKRVNWIFISLFISRKKVKEIFFHFHFSKKSEQDF